MRFIPAFSVVAAALAVAAGPAKATEEIARDVCSCISADDVRAFQRILDNHNLRLRGAYEAIRCNGYTLVQFAITAEAEDVGTLLARSLPTRALENDKVKGLHVVSWAERTGYGSSLIVRRIDERLNTN